MIRITCQLLGLVWILTMIGCGRADLTGQGVISQQSLSELLDEDPSNDPFHVGSNTSAVYSVLGEPTYSIERENGHLVLYYMTPLDTSMTSGGIRTNGGTGFFTMELSSNGAPFSSW